MTTTLAPDRPPRLLTLHLGLALGALGVAFLLYRSVIAPQPEIDFRYFWVASWMWAHQLDPYGPAYAGISRSLFTDGNYASAWVYPPHWWLIGRTLALLGYDHALIVWRLASGVMLLAGTWLLVDALLDAPRRVRVELSAAACGVACLIEPTANLLALGQSGGFTYLGLCLLTVGIVRRWRWLFVAGVLLVSLKPHLGVPVILALLMVPRYRLPVVLAGAAGLLLALPQLIPHGFVETFRELLGNLGRYNGPTGQDLTGPNSAVSSTGPFNLLARTTGIQFGPMLQLGLAVAGALAAGWLMRSPNRATAANGLLLLLSVLVGLVPLHIYDMTIILVPLILLAALERRVTWLMAAIPLLVLRPCRIESTLHVPVYGSGVSCGTVGLSIAGLTMLALAIGRLVRPDPRLHTPA